MAPQQVPTVITLKVKSPPGTIGGESDDIVLGSLNTSTTIGAIRQRLQQSIASHPEPERQRLLYGGRVLSDDDQTLADALNTKRDPSQTDFVIHLIVRGEGFNGPVNHGPAHSTNAPVQPGVSPAVGQFMQPQPEAQPMHVPHVHGIGQHGIAPAHLPLGIGIPEHARAAFSQAIAQGQQHRAAMGMHGIGHPQPGTMNPPPPSNSGAGTQENSQSGRETGGAANGQQPEHRSLSSQGFHMHGIGPDGQRFQVHHQTFNFPHALPPGVQHVPHMGPLGPFPAIPPFHNFAHMHPHAAPPGPLPQPPLPGQPRIPSALDSARENMATMRRMLDEMGTATNTTDEQRAQLRDMQERAAALNNYIDPFQLGRGMPSSPLGAGVLPIPTMPRPQATTNIGPPTSVLPSVLTPNTSHGNADDVVCYLVSSPLGPQALLFSPSHGTFRGGNSTIGQQGGVPVPTPTPTTTAAVDPQAGALPAANNEGGPGRPPEEQPAEVAQALQQLQRLQDEARALAQPDDQWGAAQPLVGHFWLLFRILVFAYFVLGSDLGWRRPLALAVIGLGFWLMRLGPFAEGGVVRRWWDGIMALPPPNQPVGPDAPAGAGGNDQNRQAMPTPAQLAERLLAERNRDRDARWQRVREWTRPIERALALFIASLWPGIGEAHVEATEREERRRNAEEVEARQRAEQERARVEAEKEQPSPGQGAEQEAKASDAGVSRTEESNVNAGETTRTTGAESSTRNEN